MDKMMREPANAGVEIPAILQKVIEEKKPCIVVASGISDLVEFGDSVALIQGDSGDFVAMIASTIMNVAEEMGITTEELAAHVVLALHSIGELGVDEPERPLS